MTDTDARLAALKALAEKATPGPWRISEDYIQAIGMTDTYAGPVWGTIVRAEPLRESDGEGRFWRANGSEKGNLTLIATLYNDAIPLAEALRKERDEAMEQLERLYAIVHGECKSLLDEDDGGEPPRMAIEKLIARKKERRGW